MASRAGAGASMPAPAPAAIRIAGVLTVGFPGVDRRPAMTAAEAERAVALFVPGVELLDGHNTSGGAAPVVGYLDTLTRTPEGLRFGGVLMDAGTLARLHRAGALPVSGEYPARMWGREPMGHNLITRTTPPPTGYLQAVAILRDGERPARAGSIVWLVRDA